MERQTVTWDYNTDADVTVDESVKAAVAFAKRLAPTDPKSTGLKKLEEASANFNFIRDRDLLNAFELHSMATKEFKDVIRRIFFVNLTSEEADALTSHYDVDNDGRLNTSSFLVEFMKLGTTRRGVTRSVWLSQERVKQASREEEHTVKLQEGLDKLKVKVDYNYSQQEFDLAMAKLTAAAAGYDPNKGGSMSLQAFEGASMPPNIFREQLKRVFGITLSLRELGALMRFFDSDGNGYIDCSEFLVQFTRTGQTERSRIRKEWRNKDLQLNEDAKQKSLEKELQNAKRGLAKVDWDFSDEEMYSTVRKLMTLAGQYNPRQVGIVGLRAFMGHSLSATEFREQMKATFSMILNPQELGAIVTYFDSDQSQRINSAEFLVHFFKLSMKVKAALGKPNQEELMEIIAQDCLADYDDRSSKAFNHRLMAEQSQISSVSLVSSQTYEEDLASEFSSENSLSDANEIKDEEEIGDVSRKQQSNRNRINFMLQFQKKHKKAVKLKKKALVRVGGTCVTAENVLAARIRNSLKTGRVDLSTLSSSRNWAESNVQALNDAIDEDKCMMSCPLIQAKEADDNKNKKKLQKDCFLLLRIPDGVMNNRFKHGVVATELWLDNNYLNSIDELQDLLSYPFMSQLKILSLSNIGIDSIPLSIVDLTRLQIINLSRNNLAAVALGLAGKTALLPCLTSLNLSHNRLSCVASSILYQMPKLNTLDLSFNDIREFEGTTVSLGHFQLSAFPSLCVLTLDGNEKISKDLALCITSIRSLRELSMSKCHEASTGNLIDVCSEFFSQSNLCGGILERIKVGSYGGFISRLDVASKMARETLASTNDEGEEEEEVQSLALQVKCPKIVDIFGDTDIELLNMLKRRAMKK